MGLRKDLDKKAIRYIYHLVDEKTKEVLYVGTAKNPKQRFKTHLKKIKENNSALIYQYCLKNKVKLKCVIVKKLNTTYNEAEKYEIKEIENHCKTVLNFYNNPNKERIKKIAKSLENFVS